MIIKLACGHDLDTIMDISQQYIEQWVISTHHLMQQPEGATGSTFDCPVCDVEHIMLRIDDTIVGMNMLKYLNESYKDFMGEDPEGGWYVLEF